ncbi:hypothetical protein PWT90_07013 [Aphanocladium album]|nr:hypothetical protein PWT90_07013 [Aphanocladium album]
MKSFAAVTLFAALASATPLEARSCRSLTIRNGDSCASLANRCGVSRDNFFKYNGGSGICSKLKIGDKVCCSAGGKRSSAETQTTTEGAGECKALRVTAGASCGSLSGKCGISGADFIRFNGEGICARLTIGQYVCCSEGDLPDGRPKPNPDGSCRTRTIAAGDSCYDYLTEYNITEDDLNEYNTNTPEWKGCSRIFAGEVICVSAGTPPTASN